MEILSRERLLRRGVYPERVEGLRAMTALLVIASYP